MEEEKVYREQLEQIKEALHSEPHNLSLLQAHRQLTEVLALFSALHSQQQQSPPQQQEELSDGEHNSSSDTGEEEEEIEEVEEEVEEEEEKQLLGIGLNFVSTGSHQLDVMNEVLTTSTISTTSERGLGLGIAQWEQHTKGIGSKLLKKMGYVEGEGLGKEGKGIAVPIGLHLKVIKERIGLGHSKRSNEEAKKRRKRKRRVDPPNQVDQRVAKKKKATSVFSFINKLMPDTPTQQIEVKTVSGMSQSDMHQALTQNMKNTELLKKKLQEYQHNLKKSAHDPFKANQIKQAIQKVQKQLHNIQGNDKEIEARIKLKNERKKLASF